METYEKLRKIHAEFGAQEFGKLCQKLLAISFRLAGYGHIVERGVQGVDVDAAQEDGNRYAIEVKTTESIRFPLGKKDIRGLHDRSKDGYQPMVAVLRLSPLSEWRFAKAEQLRTGSLLIDSLRPYSLDKLENQIKPFFDRAVREHYEGIMKRGQAYLDGLLREQGIEAQQ